MDKIFEDPEFEKYYKPFLSQMDTVLSNKSGQFMIVSPDTAILDYVVKNLKKAHNYKFVEVKKQKDEAPDKKVFLINLSCLKSMEYQSFLYFYFELPLYHDCFVCILTNSSNALNFFEKRVMSRFKNKIFFFPYYQPIQKRECEHYSSNLIHSSLLSQKNMEMIEKYHLEPFSLNFILDLFEPIHLALIMISFLNKINMVKVYDQFKILVVDTPELKKASPTRVFQCALDILECGIINESGLPLINYNEFKSFVEGQNTVYLKILLRAVSKKLI